MVGRRFAACGYLQKNARESKATGGHSSRAAEVITARYAEIQPVIEVEPGRVFLAIADTENLWAGTGIHALVWVEDSHVGRTAVHALVAVDILAAIASRP